MGLLDRLRALFGGGTTDPYSAQPAEDRLLASPDQAAQLEETSEEQRDELLDEGRPPRQ